MLDTATERHSQAAVALSQQATLKSMFQVADTQTVPTCNVL